MRRFLAAVAILVVAIAVPVAIAYGLDIASARERVASGSQVVSTRCGPIEYAARGEGPPS